MPQSQLQLPGVPNQAIDGIGHLAMLFSPRVAQALLAALERLGARPLAAGSA